MLLLQKKKIFAKCFIRKVIGKNRKYQNFEFDITIDTVTN